MALILALALGLFWAFRLSKEKAEIKEARNEYDMVRDQDEANRKMWESRVINKDLEDEFDDRLYNKDEELLREVRDTWTDYFNFFCPSIYFVEKEKSWYLDTNGKSFSDLTAIRILLANRGFLTYHDAVLGFKIGTATGDTAYQRARLYYIQEMFIIAVNNKLKKHGIDEKMYTDDGLRIREFPEEKSFDFGTVKWRPEISTFEMRAKYKE